MTTVDSVSVSPAGSEPSAFMIHTLSADGGLLAPGWPGYARANTIDVPSGVKDGLLEPPSVVSATSSASGRSPWMLTPTSFAVV